MPSYAYYVVLERVIFFSLFGDVPTFRSVLKLLEPLRLVANNMYMVENGPILHWSVDFRFSSDSTWWLVLVV